MAKKPEPKNDEAERTEEARKAAEDYANDQRAIIKKLRKPAPDG